MFQVQFNDTRVKVISQDYLTKNKTKSNLLIQVTFQTSFFKNNMFIFIDVHKKNPGAKSAFNIFILFAMESNQI